MSGTGFKEIEIAADDVAMYVELEEVLAKLASEEMLNKDLSEVEAWLFECGKRLKGHFLAAHIMAREEAKKKQEQQEV